MSDMTKEELEQALAEAREVLEFYGLVSNWCYSNVDENVGIIHPSDLYRMYTGEKIGGKRARKWLERWGE